MPDCSDCISEGAEHRAGDGADAAGKRRAADHGGGDDQKLVERALRIGRRVQARGRDGAGDGGEQAPSA